MCQYCYRLFPLISWIISLVCLLYTVNVNQPENLAAKNRKIFVCMCPFPKKKKTLIHVHTNTFSLDLLSKYNYLLPFYVIKPILQLLALSARYSHLWSTALVENTLSITPLMQFLYTIHSSKVSYIQIWVRLMVMAFNANFNNISVISWRSVLLVEETRLRVVPQENHRPVANHWQIYHIMLYQVHLTMRLTFELTTLVAIFTDCIR